MTPAAAILGKGGVGKTFVAAHLAMALGYLGVKTLLVGCDQKRDTRRAVTSRGAPSLMEALEALDYEPAALRPEQVLVPAADLVDVLELGPSPLLVGDYGRVHELAWAFLDAHDLPSAYGQLLFDVTDERLDAPQLPLLRRLRTVVGVTDESAESLFVLNRMLRGLLIGGHEMQLQVRVLGMVNNRSQDPAPFHRYAQVTHCAPLLSVPALQELAALRAEHVTLFAKERLPAPCERALQGFLSVAGLLRQTVLALQPVMPLPDEEVWRLKAPGPPQN